jgi:hypothetical protein
MPWSSGKTLCIARWPTMKTATTNASSVSDQNAGSRLKCDISSVRNWAASVQAGLVLKQTNGLV